MICNHNISINYKSRIDASAWIYREMMSEYKLMHYSGNSDGAVPTSGTRAWIAKMGLRATRAERNYVTAGNSSYTGQITEFGNFTFATINGTGHMAPPWKREEVTTLITNFIHGEPI
jgi:serine carboxypeptidase-like clade 2